MPATTAILDAVLIAVAGGVGVLGRPYLTPLADGSDIYEAVGVAGPIMLLGWLTSIAVLGGYREEVFGAGADEYKRVLRASLFASGFSTVVFYLAKFDLSRSFFLLTYGLGLPLLLIGRFLLRRLLYAARRRGLLTRTVLVAGTGSHIDDIARVLSRDSFLGYRVLGALTPDGDPADETASGVPVLGTASEAPRIADEVGADVLCFAGGSVGSAAMMREMFWTLERQQVSVIIAPSVTDVSSERVAIRPIGGLPLIHVDPPTWSDASRWGKRLFDVLGSLAIMVLLAPVLAFVAVRVALHDRGPVLFGQTRIGRHGEPFECLKFRTMLVAAESMIESLQAEQNASALLFKDKDDPRITGPGRWMRRFSFDELPQLFNVLRGDMSLVGPRPQVAAEVELYDHAMSRRLHVRPGMTGLWQISGRSDLTAEEAMRLDLYYVDNWSMMQDLSILAYTAGAVISSRGAY